MKVHHVGLFGLGTVGSSALSILSQNAALLEKRIGSKIKVSRIVTSNPAKKRSVDIGNIPISSNPDDILNDDSIDIVVELIGGTDAADYVVTEALKRGKHVVTANKALLAEKGSKIFQLAYKQGLTIAFEGAVGGGIPILRSLKQGLVSENITEIVGILNGTSNYILSAMHSQGCSLESSLAEAQELGYAELDPFFDVEGYDAAHKLAILSNLAYGGITDYKGIYVEGITKLKAFDIRCAADFGYSIKHLAISKPSNGSVEARVHPALVPNNHLLASVNGVFNAVFLYGDNVGETMSFGKGAGGSPTGSAVVSDIADLARNLSSGILQRIPPLAVSHDKLKNISVEPISNIVSRYYIRFPVNDEAGVLGKISTVMSNHGVSFHSMRQYHHKENPSGVVEVVVLTHQATERDVIDSLSEISKFDFNHSKPQLIRIKDLE